MTMTSEDRDQIALLLNEGLASHAETISQSVAKAMAAFSAGNEGRIQEGMLEAQRQADQAVVERMRPVLASNVFLELVKGRIQRDELIHQEALAGLAILLVDELLRQLAEKKPENPPARDPALGEVDTLDP